MDKNVETLGLAENSPLQSFSKACTQGLLSVRIQVLTCDCMMYGLKNLVAVAMASASISHGSHVTCLSLSLALKKPANITFLSLMAYRVAPMPCILVEPSVTIHNWSSALGSTIVRQVDKAFCASAKAACDSSDHGIRSFDWRPVMVLSRGAIYFAQLGSTRARILYTPMKERRPLTVSGLAHEANVVSCVD